MQAPGSDRIGITNVIDIGNLVRNVGTDEHRRKLLACFDVDVIIGHDLDSGVEQPFFGRKLLHDTVHNNPTGKALSVAAVRVNYSQSAEVTYRKPNGEMVTIGELEALCGCVQAVKGADTYLSTDDMELGVTASQILTVSR